MLKKVKMSFENKDTFCKIYHTVAEEYNKDWFENYVISSYFDIARDSDDNLMAHCILLSVTPAEMDGWFKIKKRSGLMLTVCVFEDDKKLIDFINYSGSKILCACISNGKELIKT